LNVEHIYLLEDFAAGRFKRRKGEFLCTSASESKGNRGRPTVEPVERAHDGAGAPYRPKVTCKACLRRAAALIDRYHFPRGFPVSHRPL